jgi:PAS domain S-box-containing protein
MLAAFKGRAADRRGAERRAAAGDMFMGIHELRRSGAAQTVAVALLVFALACCSIVWARSWGGGACPIWLPNAVWLAFLLHAPRRRWPALLLAGMAGNIAGTVAVGPGIAVALGAGPLNLAQVLACALIVKALPGGRIAVQRAGAMLGFCAAVIAASVTQSFLAALWIAAVSHAAVAPAWMSRALSNTLGMLAVAPALSLIAEGGVASLTRPGKRAQDLAFFAGLAGVVALAAVLPSHPMILLSAPALVFAALQLEFAAAALAMMIVCGACVSFVALGMTPMLLEGRTPVEQLTVLQGSLVLAVVTTLPIAAVMTRRRELEAALVASLESLAEANRQAKLAESLAGVGYWSFEIGREHYQWSEQMYQIYGRDRALGPPTPDQMVGFVHPDDRETLLRHRIEQAESEEPELDVRIVRPSGEVRHVIARSRVERDAAGKVAVRFGTCADVTEIKRTEAAARRSEERYRFLAENAPDMIVRTKLGGEIIYISPGSMQVFGRTPEEMRQLNANDMVHPDDMDRVTASIFRLIEERLMRLPEPISYRARHKDGQWIWIEANPTLICNDDGEPVEFIDVVRDVTQAKLVAVELEEARRRAEAAAAAKAAFLANMSHELRTPLTSIIGFSQLMGERKDLPSEAKHYAQRISDASEALLAIINDVLDFSKLEAGQVALEMQPLSVRRLVDETMGLIAIQAAAKGLELRAELDPGAPELVVADVARLRQVLLNFLSNAVKFTAAGSVTVRTAWKGSRRGGRLKISVTDTGAGVARENVGRLFERFSQAEVSINRTHGGTGLGLAISKGIVELMGGRIGVRTKPGAGSTFWFELPMKAAEADSRPVEIQTDLECPKLRLLVVDDTAVNRELVRLMLTPAGLEIEEAAGGAEGVKAAMARPFDLILMDVRMPGVDGLEATRVIRAMSQANRATPILALTADVQPDNAAACRAAGMDDILAKPIVASELIAKIVHWASQVEPAEATGTDG